MKSHVLGFWLASSNILSLLSSNPTIAQIAADETLTRNTVVRQQGNVTVIEGGTKAGANLYHSFGSFSVPTGTTAFFDNSLDIQNIISRVTGKSISNIDGLIRALGTANLFLINPLGIIFGQNARLDIGGSFIGSTADSIKFADGLEFSAINPQSTPLLSINVPVGLQMGQNPGSITVQGTGYDLSVAVPIFTPIIRGTKTNLQVQPGKTLALVGGNVTLEGSTLTAEQGLIELGGAANGEVKFNLMGFDAFNYQDVQTWRDIALSKQALVDASNGGSIYVRGNNIMLANGSLMLIQNQALKQGGSINVNAIQSFTISGVSPDSRLIGGLDSQTLGNVTGADIAVSAKQLMIRDGAAVVARSYNLGKTGNISVNVLDSTQAVGFSAINPNFSSGISTTAFSSGDAGDINLSTGQLTVVDGGQISSTSLGIGHVGNVIVNTNKYIEIIGQTNLFKPSNISSTTLNRGDAGQIVINTPKLIVRDGGSVSTSTLASGKAGSLIINATESVQVSGKVSEAINPSFIGSSANRVNETLQQNFRIPIVLSGPSGDVTVNTDKLTVTNGARIEVSNQGTGNAGRLLINGKSIFLDAQGTITAATASGQGGNIDLQVKDLLLMRGNSQVSSTADGVGNGGNININTPILVAVPQENSDISANSVNSRGGRITINAQAILGTQFRNRLTLDSDITATGANPQLNGTVQINTPDIDPTKGLTELPVEVSNRSRLIAQACPAYKGNSFTITGRSGLPSSPRESLRNNQTATVDWVTIRKKVEQSRKVNSNNQELIIKDLKSKISNSVIEANAWEINKSGEVQLIASAPNLINTNSSVSACTSDNAVRSN
ncbi:hypothetical protein NIES2101_39955 [Calothrix sp. HK-06]|nr:hypothetical protein NIES2101_39955 [Calothrix sp. HK-06]